MPNTVTSILDKVASFLPAEWQGKFKESRKALVAGLGALLSVLTLISTKFGWLVPPQYKKQIAIVLVILTTALTWLTPNESTDPSGA